MAILYYLKFTNQPNNQPIYNQKSAKNGLLRITVAMRTCPNAAVEIMLDNANNLQVFSIYI